MLDDFDRQALDEDHAVFTGRLPDELVPDEEGFEALWALHPESYHQIKIHGRLVHTPRWQQAYGADYRYTGQVNEALAVTEELAPFLAWAQEAVDPRLNGALLNWYDGQKGHYIGRHRDSMAQMIEGSPIVTISLGQERVFRLRPWKGRGFVDFTVGNGAVLILPYTTNAAWTHEVPHFARYDGRRISVTARAFRDEQG